MRIALTIPTGRPIVKQVVKAFVDNAIYHGYDPASFSVYLSVDTSFQGTRKRDFKLDTCLETRLSKVHYISHRDRQELGKSMIDAYGVDHLVARDLFLGKGYSKQRNSALLAALKDGNDIAICFDDDEYPAIPIETKGENIQWQELDFFGPHLMTLIAGADVTRGPCLGYLSPIPSDFERDVPGRIRRKLGEALQPGSDVINRDSFFNLMNKIIYLPGSKLYNPTRPLDAEETKFGKHIFSGNMGINLNSLREGKVPLFYTPPDARGEDTIFALQLKDSRVVEVPSYIFHDPFSLYPRILKKELPEKLKPVPVNEKTTGRFADAVLGWLKYAPLFIFMTSQSSQEREERIREMLEKIDDPAKKLAELLEYPRFKECKQVLSDYQDRVLSHYDALMRAQDEWRKKILPGYIGSN